MELLSSVFNILLYQPLFNILVLLYQYFPGQDFGLAIIILTILIKIALYPLGSQAINAQKKLAQLQPKVQELQRKYKNNREKLVQETLELYRKEKINPFSGFLPILIQIPILIALFRVFWRGLGSEQISNLYSFVPNPGQINPTFLGLLNLSEPNLILAFLAGTSQFVQSKMIAPAFQREEGQGSPKNPDFSRIIQKQMLYFFPILTVFILWKLPSAIALYWTVTSLFTIGEQYLVGKNQIKTKIDQ